MQLPRKLIRQSFVLLFTIALITPLISTAIAAPSERGVMVVVKLRAPAGAVPAEGAARFGNPGLDRVLDRLGASRVEPLFRYGPKSNLAARSRNGLDRYYRIHLPKGGDARAAAAEFRRAGDVVLAMESGAPRNALDTASNATVELLPNDPSFDRQWPLRNTGANAGVAIPLTADADIDATDAWSVTTGSPAVTVALVSTGIDFGEPDLAGRFWENTAEALGAPGVDDDGNGYVDDVRGWDFIEGDNNPAHIPDNPANPNQATFDTGSTRLASIIGATGNNSIGIAGVDWGCRLMPLRLTSGGFFTSSEDLAGSFVYAAELGARVIVTAIVWSDLTPEEEVLFGDAIAAAQALGAVIAAPVGTSSTDGNSSVFYPAANPGVIGVGTTEGRDLHCDVARCTHWSLTGAQVALVSPGRLVPAINPVAGGPSSVVNLSAGSAAASLAAGAAAMVIAANPSLTAEQVGTVLKNTADDQVGDPAEDLPGRDDYHGYGRLNVDRAVRGAMAANPPMISALTTANVLEGASAGFDITVSDADGDPIDALTADFTALPAGITPSFTPAADHSSAHVEIQTSAGTAGNYTMSFTATSTWAATGLPQSSTVTVGLAVLVNDQPPGIVSNIADPSSTVAPGTPFSFVIDVFEPEGDPITSFTATSSVSGATLTLSNENRHAVWSWTAAASDIGCYSVTFVVESTSNAPGATPKTLVITDTFVITTNLSGPEIRGRTGVQVQVGGHATLSLRASDPDGDVPTWFARTLPPDMLFDVAPDHLSATLSWSPTPADLGSTPMARIEVSTLPWPACAQPIQGPLVSSLNISFLPIAEDLVPTVTLVGQCSPSGIYQARIGQPLVVESVIEEYETEPVTVIVSGLPPGATTVLYDPNDPTLDPLGLAWRHRILWTAAPGQEGTYPITVTATSIDDVTGLPVSRSATGTIVASPVDTAPPVVVAPATVTGDPGTLIEFSVSASDPDGEVIESMQAIGDPLFGGALPAGATFTPTGVGTLTAGGTFSWTPTAAQSGTYVVRFSAATMGPCFPTRDFPSGSAAITSITVTGGVGSSLPVVVAPASVTGAPGSLIQIDVSASDPDGDVIQRLNAIGLNKTLGMSFTTTGVGTASATGTFSWTPLTAPQTATITFRASNGCSGPTGPCTYVGQATTSILVEAPTNLAPTIDAIEGVTVAEGAGATVAVHASDAEGDAISLSASLPAFGVLNAPASGSGDLSTTITLTPGFSDAGSYSATVSEAGGASVSFGITVSNTDQGLALTAPASVSAAERSLLTVDVTASDPDGEPVTSLTADLSGLPAGNDAAFSIVGDPLPAVTAAGRLTWTPSCAMAGTYSVSFTAVSGNTATATVAIAVANVGAAPAIAAIGDQTVAEGAALSLAVTATDADLDPIALGATLPAFGSFVDNGSGTGTVTLAPGYMHSGTYPGSVTATDACDGSATLAFTITVLNTDRPVTIAAAASAAASEGVPFTMTVLARDDDGETISLAANLTSLPAGNDAAFGDAAVGMLERQGTLTWTPTYDDAGNYPVTFTASAGAATATATTTISVANTNRAPSVSAPASQSVNEGSSLSIAISASDPDGAGTPLTLTANVSGLPSGPSFADNHDNTGLFTWTPSYSDASGSPYFVTFSASDGTGGVGTAVTQITVLDVASAIAFPASKSVLRLSSGKPSYCAVLEPVGGSFLLTDVNWGTVRMNSAGTGTVASIGIDATKSIVVGDHDGNLVQDATFCFGKTDLRNIFALVSGRQTVPVTITGSLMGGATFVASLNVEVIGSGGALAASVSPNPLNPEAVLTFELASAAQVRVSLHDIQGRLVRSLANESMAAGWHDLRIDGRDDGGRALRSGVYFYRIETGSGTKTGQLTILK